MFGLFLSYCILYVLDHILSCLTGFLDLENVCLDSKIMCLVWLKGKVFPYSLPSVGPKDDPGVQAVSPQVTWSESCHRPGSRLPLLSARPTVGSVVSPDGATCKWQYTSDSSLLLIYRPRKDERLSWPSWLTCSGRLTRISGHPSAAGRGQDRESSPVRDRRSTTVPRHQLIWLEAEISPDFGKK